MSDPYDHGETCDCEKCIAFSEGFEAGASITPPTDPRSITFWFKTKAAARAFTAGLDSSVWRRRSFDGVSDFDGTEDCYVFDVDLHEDPGTPKLETKRPNQDG